MRGRTGPHICDVLMLGGRRPCRAAAPSRRPLAISQAAGIASASGVSPADGASADEATMLDTLSRGAPIQGSSDCSSSIGLKGVPGGGRRVRRASGHRLGASQPTAGRRRRGAANVRLGGVLDLHARRLKRGLMLTGPACSSQCWTFGTPSRHAHLQRVRMERAHAVVRSNE